MTSQSRPDDIWLSVAMPVHCGERWLPATLASVANQDCAGIEFIMIDSGPQSKCASIAASFSDRLNLSYQYRSDVKPWTTKTNLAVQQARGTHIVMLHQDDLWRDDRVADMRRAIAADRDAALLLNPSQIIDQNGRELGVWRCPLRAGRPVDGSRLVERLLVQNFVAIPAPIVRREAWLAAGGLDDALWYTADWDLYLKLAGQGSTVYREEVTTAFRIHEGSLTVRGSADATDFANQMRCVIERHIERAPARKRNAIRRCALASTAVNCALAQAMSGNIKLLSRAFLQLLCLGPVGLTRYLRDSRIVERALPRLRARFAGGL